jgi:hypothetical protein
LKRAVKEQRMGDVFACLLEVRTTQELGTMSSPKSPTGAGVRWLCREEQLMATQSVVVGGSTLNRSATTKLTTTSERHGEIDHLRGQTDVPSRVFGVRRFALISRGLVFLVRGVAV